jgi:hypothetical protein
MEGMDVTVYITQHSHGRDFLPARKYGELEALLQGNVQIVISGDPVLRKIKRGLRNFNDDDHLLLSGDPLIMGVAVYEALRVNGGRARFLKWDRRNQDYFEVSLDLRERKNDEE